MSWIERQLPEGDSVFLDHVGFFVADIEAAGPRLERLGFRVQPVSVHYDEGPDGTLSRSGTANRLVTFAAGYLEVLGAVADTPLADQLRGSLARYEGLHLIALTHPRVAERGPRFAAAGLEMQPTVQLRRRLDEAQGSGTVKATVARCRPGVMEEGRAQMLTHDTPERIWLPGYEMHPNGVDALQELLVVSADASGAAERYQRFSGCPVTTGDGLHRVSFDRGWLSFTDPDHARGILPGLRCASLPYCAALALRTPDLERARAALEAGGVRPVFDTGDVVTVGPDAGLGAYLVFQACIDAGVWGKLAAASSGRAVPPGRPEG